MLAKTSLTFSKLVVEPCHSRRALYLCGNAFNDLPYCNGVTFGGLRYAYYAYTAGLEMRVETLQLGTSRSEIALSEGTGDCTHCNPIPSQHTHCPLCLRYPLARPKREGTLRQDGTRQHVHRRRSSASQLPCSGSGTRYARSQSISSRLLLHSRPSRQRLEEVSA